MDNRCRLASGASTESEEQSVVALRLLTASPAALFESECDVTVLLLLAVFVAAVTVDAAGAAADDAALEAGESSSSSSSSSSG